MSVPVIITLLFYLTLMIHAGVGDLRTMRIPNRLVLLLFFGYLAAMPLALLSLSEVVWSFAAAIIVFVLGFVGFSLGWMGGGDVKLMTVVALWLGAGNVVSFIFYMSLFGAILTIIILIFRAVSLPIAWQEREWISRLHQPGGGVPYGVAIAAAGILVYFRTPWVTAQF